MPVEGPRAVIVSVQFEEADEIDVVEHSFRIVRHKRQKYRCRCGEKIETAFGPDKLIPGGRYSIDFAVDVAIAKFADHLPLSARSARWPAMASTWTPPRSGSRPGS